jgi:hypothetical protein
MAKKLTLNSFPINTILRFNFNKDDGTLTTEDFRVIYEASVSCFLFNIDPEDTCDPENRPKEELVSLVSSGKAEILPYDPAAERFLILEKEISQSIIQKRDKAYEIVSSVVYVNGQFNVDVFDSRKRKKLVRKAISLHYEKYHVEISKKTVLRYLRKFWRNGLTRDAVSPYYDHCGAQGTFHNNKDVRIGRKSSEERDEGTSFSPKYDGEMLRYIFYEALESQYKSGVHLTGIRDKILTEYFVKEWMKDENGISKPILDDEKLLPSYEQLYNFFQKEWRKDPIKWEKRKLGEREYQKSVRPKLGGQAKEAYSPGFLYQIDSTIVDIYLVLSTDRSIICLRPTVYAIMDAATHMVVGFAQTAERAKYVASLLSFDNAFADKVKYCAEHGINITKDMWPAEGKPIEVRADRAELLSKISDQIVKLGIRLSITASYRPDWKGLVERIIGLINKNVHDLPGGVNGPHKRGEKDARLFACLTPEEFEQILIKIFVFYNNYHVLEDFVPSFDMMQDHVPAIPSVLWAYETENRGGSLQPLDRDMAMMHLLPQGKVSSTGEGFLFKKKLYHTKAIINKLAGTSISDEEAMVDEERMAVVAQVKGNKKFPIVYDPRKPQIIWCQFQKRQRFFPLYLSEEFSGYQGMHDLEWEKLNDLHVIQTRKKQAEEDQARAHKKAEMDPVINKAKEEAQIARKGQSKTEQIKGIQENGQVQLQHERDHRPLLPDPDKYPAGFDMEPVVEAPEPKTNSSYNHLASKIDLLEKINEELEDSQEK